MPKVSVVVPVYNVELYLRECLDSIVNQTLKDIEIICVDDGSPDNSGKILDEYAAKDSRIKVFHKENGGYGSALNCGFEIATGEYIGIVESDDWIADDMYERLYNKAVNTDADIVKGNYYYVDPNTMEMRRNKTFQNIIARTDEINFREDPEILLVFASIWSCLYKREWMKTNNIKVVEDIKPYEDQPFLAETFSKANKIVLEGCAEYYYRFANENSTTATTKPSILNYMFQKSRIRDIFIQNDCYSKKVMEFYWKGAYYGAMDWLNKPNNKYKLKFYKMAKELFAKAKQDGCQFLQFEKHQKREFNSVLKYPFFIFKFICNFKKISRTIFSVSNVYTDKVKRKIITLFGIKIKIKKRQSLNDRLTNIETSLENVYHLIKINIDPKKLPHTRGILRLQQLGSFSLLKYLVIFLEQNNLQYWIDFGTLLGAVRHKGFIPWDDDIDISMPRKDYEKFSQILNEFCGNTFKYSQGDITRVFYKNSTAQVDIFPYDSGYSVELPKSEEYNRFTEKLEALYLAQNKDFSDFKTNTIPRMYKPELYRVYRENLLQGKDVPEKAFMFLAHHCFAWKRVLYRYDDIFPLKEIEFEGQKFKCPNKMYLYMNKYWGDFMNLPKKCYTHHLHVDAAMKDEENIKNIITLIKSNNPEGLNGVYDETSSDIWNI